MLVQNYFTFLTLPFSASDRQTELNENKWQTAGGTPVRQPRNIQSKDYYRHNLILWLGDSVPYCFLWLFSPFPFPTALFYAVVRSDSTTMVIGFYDYFPSDLRWKATLLVVNYSCLRQFQLIMLAMLSTICQTRGNLQFQLMMMADANKDQHHLWYILPPKQKIP